eukprot:NODE_402_length_979_cov_395.520430_g309_i0.p1 GENE.NODE_402_length_979_cov_395.520430_g309_i0~~NODE_402_length_979_cov_395.520430_g309_i0.p1  ORF type:complete len:138 (+),score=13.07 NODE_402_length_979_cov_395.520430_g309_i0:468-881(+)
MFQGRSDQYIKAVVIRLKPVVALPDSFVIRKNEIGNEMYFISKGEVEVVSEDGETVFATLRDGAFFGEVALIRENTTRTASIKAKTFCDLFTLNKKDFADIKDKFPEDVQTLTEVAEKRVKLARANEDRGDDESEDG